MSGGWCSWDIPRVSILNISTKCISVLIFSVLVHQICVLDTKKLVITYSFCFGEIFYKHPKNVPKEHLQCDALGMSSRHKFDHQKKKIFREMVLYFLLPSVYQMLQSQIKL